MGLERPHLCAPSDLLQRQPQTVQRQGTQKIAPHAALDFGEPVGVLFASVLHFLSDADDPAAVIGELLAPFPPGSHVALTHGTADGAPQVRSAARVYDAATTRMSVRGRDEVLALVRGLDVVEPGLVWTPEWHPEPGEPIPDRPSDCYYYALVARKP